MVFDRYLDNSALITAASSSNCGIVFGFMGATRILDIMNVRFVPLLEMVPLIKATAPYATWLLSQNTSI